MIAIKQDPTGSHIVRWPETPSEVILLARRYTARQSALPVDQRMTDVPLATVLALLAQADSAIGSAVTGETERASAAETLRQKFEQARPLLTLIVQRLKRQNARNLADLERWGLPTRLGARGVTVRKPITPTQIIHFLRAYVEKETSLPPTSRITDPPLATVQTLLDELETGYITRYDARSQRELGNHQRAQVIQDLSDWLEIAALILSKRDGGVPPALEAHGFTVVGHTAPGTYTGSPPANGTPPPSGEPS